MRYRNLGKSGLKVSVIGLGTNQFGGKVDQASANNILSAALDAGVNFIDTADIYQSGRSETQIGEALKGRRDQALIGTKVFGKVGDGPNDKGSKLWSHGSRRCRGNRTGNPIQIPQWSWRRSGRHRYCNAAAIIHATCYRRAKEV